MAKDKKDLLIRKAAQLFLQDGYHETSIRRLAEALGIQPGGIYNYFKSKEEILLHIQYTGADRFRKNIIEEMIKIDAPEDKVKTLISNVVYQLFAFGEIPLLMLQNFLPKKTEQLRKKGAKEAFYFIRDTLEALTEKKGIQKPIDPTVAAFSLIGMTSWIYKWYNPKGRISVDNLIHNMTRLFFQGFYVGEVDFEESDESFIQLLPHFPNDADVSGDRKEFLLKKAAELFLEFGYSKTSMKKLAEATGLQAPAIYHYFKSKEEILFGLEEAGARTFRKKIIEKVNDLDDAEEKIKILIANVINILPSYGGLPLLMLQGFWPKKTNIVRKKRARETFHFIRDALQELAESKGIQEPIDPTVAAFSLIGMTSWIYKWHNPKGRISLEMLIHNVMRLFFQGFYVQEVMLGEKFEMQEIQKRRPVVDGIMVIPSLNEDPHLLAGRCSKCERTFFPKRKICPDCFENGVIEEIALSHEGKLATFTIVRRSLGARKAPYALGYIETPEKIRILAPLTNCNFEELRIGMDMKLVFEEEEGEDGNLVVVYKYQPAR